MKQLLFIVTIFIVFAGCKGPLSKPVADSKHGIHIAKVEEVIHAAGYTYLNVSEKRKKTWIAVPEMKISNGEKISYSGGLVMENFHSKELNRTFPTILFLQGVNMDANPQMPEGMKAAINGSAAVQEKINILIKPGDGCISVATLLETKSQLSGKTVKLRGKVTKFNAEIMGKNWAHIQDGTEFNGAFDFTITTDSQVAVGDTVTFEGRIALKKDLGSGYYYEVLMEEGKLIK